MCVRRDHAFASSISEHPPVARVCLVVASALLAASVSFSRVPSLAAGSLLESANFASGELLVGERE